MLFLALLVVAVVVVVAAAALVILLLLVDGGGGGGGGVSVSAAGISAYQFHTTPSHAIKNCCAMFGGKLLVLNQKILITETFHAISINTGSLTGILIIVIL